MSTETTTQQNTQDLSNSLLVVGLKEGKHFEFLSNKEKTTIKMIGDEEVKKASLFALRSYLKEEKIKYVANKGYVYIGAPEDNAKNMNTQKNFVPTNDTEALLYVLNLHQILFFVKEQGSIEMKIQCIDAEEIKKVIEICNFYHITFESVPTKFELVLLKTFDFERITTDKVTSSEIANPKKFSKELIDSIYAVDYELGKQGVTVDKPVERLVKDLTRSTRYTMRHNKKNINFITDFSKKMMIEYGVDVLQDPIDQHTFFVLGSKDAEFSNSAQESADRLIRKTKQSIHPVSKLLIEKGIKHSGSNDKQSPSFTLRLDEQKFPKNILFIMLT